eukprot:scaffold1821_cov344-Pavlova_lutheri.AAC.1
MARTRGQNREGSGEQDVRQSLRAGTRVRQTVPIRHRRRHCHVVAAATQRAGVHPERRIRRDPVCQARRNQKTTPHDVHVRQCAGKPGKPAAGAHPRRVHQRKLAVRNGVRRKRNRIRRLRNVHRHARAMERRQRAAGTAQTRKRSRVRTGSQERFRRAASTRTSRRKRAGRGRRVGERRADLARRNRSGSPGCGHPPRRTGLEGGGGKRRRRLPGWKHRLAVLRPPEATAHTPGPGHLSGPVHRGGACAERFALRTGRTTGAAKQRHRGDGGGDGAVPADSAGLLAFRRSIDLHLAKADHSAHRLPPGCRSTRPGHGLCGFVEGNGVPSPRSVVPIRAPHSARIAIGHQSFHHRHDARSQCPGNVLSVVLPVHSGDFVHAGFSDRLPEDPLGFWRLDRLDMYRPSLCESYVPFGPYGTDLVLLEGRDHEPVRRHNEWSTVTIHRPAYDNVQR